MERTAVFPSLAYTQTIVRLYANDQTPIRNLKHYFESFTFLNLASSSLLSVLYQIISESVSL